MVWPSARTARRVLTRERTRRRGYGRRPRAKQIGPPLQPGVWIMAFSPDGKIVLMGGAVMVSRLHAKNTTHLWEVDTGKQFGPTLQGGAIAFSPDGRTILTHRIGPTPQGKGGALSPDRGKALGSAGGVGLWDVATGKQPKSTLKHSIPVVAAAFSPDGKIVLTGSGLASNDGDWRNGKDMEGRLWETATGKQVGPPLHLGAPVQSVAFSPDGKTVLTASKFKTQMCEAATGKPIGLPLSEKAWIDTVAFSPDGLTVLTGSNHGKAQLWEVATGKQIGPPLQTQDQRQVRAVAFSPDGKTLLTGGGDPYRPKGGARLWEAATGKEIGPPLQHQGLVSAAAFSPDGQTVLTGSWDNTARLWETATGKQLGPPLQHEDKVVAVAFSPDGKTVLTAGEDITARLWETATGKQIGPPLQHHDLIFAVAFSPDGKTVLTGSRDGAARLWDAGTGKQLGPPLQHRLPVRALAFSPDGKTVLTASDDKTAQLWRVPQVRGDSERILLWTQVITGLELDEHGLVRVLDAETWHERRQRLHNLGGPPEN